MIWAGKRLSVQTDYAHTMTIAAVLMNEELVSPAMAMLRVKRWTSRHKN